VTPKRYDRAYFDRWYRDPRTRVKSAAEIARKVRMALGVAEYLLDRPVRSVLDVGSGEGAWRAPLRRLRPGVRYVGVDPSEYVVARFGARRGIVLGDVEHLDRLALAGPFDLVVCCDVLNYLPDAALARGLRNLRDLLGGVAYLELFDADDEMAGDTRGWHHRPARYYRSLLRRRGLVACGMHCYVGEALAPDVATLERP
jgi:SAM-dependent methyltransferase